MLFRLFPQYSRTALGVRRLYSRYGGDEFVVLQKGGDGARHYPPVFGDNQQRARALRDTLLFRMSIGYARYGDGINTWQDLSRCRRGSSIASRPKKEVRHQDTLERGARPWGWSCALLRLWGATAHNAGRGAARRASAAATRYEINENQCAPLS